MDSGNYFRKLINFSLKFLDQSQINVQSVPVSNRIPLDFRPSEEPKPSYTPVTIALPTIIPTTSTTIMPPRAMTMPSTQQTPFYPTTRRSTRMQSSKKTSRRVSSMNTTPIIPVDTVNHLYSKSTQIGP